MNCFAITPDKLTPEELRGNLPIMQKHPVSHLYLRARSLYAEIEQLAALIRRHGIMPIVPRALYRDIFAAGCGIHTRSDERFDPRRTPPGLLQTAACHSADAACTLLDNGADYVFISPVYRPFSKPGDRRPLIAPDDLSMLARRYGERIVLLGGLTPERIKDMHTMLRADFSIAGISMFFTTGNSHEHEPDSDIHQ
jgi:thiamine monophosphate synthase